MSNEAQSEIVRVRVLLAGMLAGLFLLGGVLWRVQVVHASEYRESLDRQSIRRVRLPATRGRVFDRHGLCVADNRPSYCIAVYVEELRRPGRWENTVEAIDLALNDLSTVLGVPKQIGPDDIMNHIKRRLPLPLLAWRDIDSRTLARWAETGAIMPGVDIYVEPVRTYPEGKALAHILGYVGSADPARNEAEPVHYYLPEMEGKTGLERCLDGRLCGVTGGRLIRVDASGFKHEEKAERRPLPGDDLRLTVDARVQRVAGRVMSDELGAVVVLDPRNGDVLAMFSSPSFDPNLFVPAISVEEWSRLNEDSGRPLLNRAISGQYPPGSIFKPLVALAALESGQADADTLLNCDGAFELAGVSFGCWNRYGHGHIAMRKALEQSCNCYFCQLGLKCGYDRIYHMADAIGIGHRTGIELTYEARGLLPDADYNRRTRGVGWRAGDTCNVSIGQGDLLVTPLQMAVYVAAIANGGYVYRPRLLDEGLVRGEIVNRMAWSAASLALVRGGMYDVVEAETGTGRNARVPGIHMAGKTGTAEFGPRARRRKHTWMTVFAPFEAPRFAVAMVIEEGSSGGTTVAPRIRELVEGILEIERGGVGREGGAG